MILIRIGSVLILSGILVGLLFPEGEQLILVGIVFWVAEISRQLVSKFAGKKDDSAGVFPHLRVNQEEI